MSIKHHPLPPLNLLQKLFYVSKTSPSGLRWKNPRVKRIKPGSIAGNKTPDSYWRVGITTDKARSYLAHRIVFFLQTGLDPGHNQVDHVNGLGDPISLRLASPQQNKSNQVNKKACFSSKYKGVSWNKQRKKWRACLYFDYRQIHLGFFVEEKEAAKAYDKAAVEFFGEYAKINLARGM